MALSTTEQKLLNELIEKRQAKLKAKAKAEQEAELAGLELKAFLAERKLTSAKSSSGVTAAIVEMVNYRDIKADLVEQDFPKAEYPDLYTPEYKVLKDLANARAGLKDPTNTAAVSKYLGFSQHLRIRTPQKRSTFHRKGTR